MAPNAGPAGAAARRPGKLPRLAAAAAAALAAGCVTLTEAGAAVEVAHSAEACVELAALRATSVITRDWAEGQRWAEDDIRNQAAALGADIIVVRSSDLVVFSGIVVEATAYRCPPPPQPRPAAPPRLPCGTPARD